MVAGADASVSLTTARKGQSMNRAWATAGGSGRAGEGIDAGHHADGVLGADRAWRLLLAVRRRIDGGEVRAAGGELGFSFADGSCRPDDPCRAELVVDRTGAVLARRGVVLDPAAAELLDLHLAHALCPRAKGHVVA